MVPRLKFSEADKVIHDQFTAYGRNAKEWARKCALLLPEIERRQIWRKRGFGSLFEYAAKLAGMSRNSVEDALRILRKIEDKPALQKVVASRGLNAVRPVVAIATAGTDVFWAGKAREMSKNTLEVYVREYKKLDTAQFGKGMDQCRNGECGGVNGGVGSADRLDFRTSTAGQPEKFVTMNLTPEVAAELLKLKGRGDWNSLMKELLELRRQKLEEEKPKMEESAARHSQIRNPNSEEKGAEEPNMREPNVSAVEVKMSNLAAAKSRYIPAKIKKFVIKKTRGQCGYPGCAKPYEILHHTERWALQKNHDPDKLVPLCIAHERIAHHGLIAHEDGPVEQWGILKRPIWWDAKRMVDQTVIRNRITWQATSEGGNNLCTQEVGKKSL